MTSESLTQEAASKQTTFAADSTKVLQTPKVEQSTGFEQDLQTAITNLQVSKLKPENRFAKMAEIITFAGLQITAEYKAKLFTKNKSLHAKKPKDASSDEKTPKENFLAAKNLVQERTKILKEINSDYESMSVSKSDRIYSLEHADFYTVDTSGKPLSLIPKKRKSLSYIYVDYEDREYGEKLKELDEWQFEQLKPKYEKIELIDRQLHEIFIKQPDLNEQLDSKIHIEQNLSKAWLNYKLTNHGLEFFEQNEQKLATFFGIKYLLEHKSPELSIQQLLDIESHYKTIAPASRDIESAVMFRTNIFEKIIGLVKLKEYQNTCTSFLSENLIKLEKKYQRKDKSNPKKQAIDNLNKKLETLITNIKTTTKRDEISALLGDFKTKIDDTRIKIEFAHKISLSKKIGY